MVVWSNRLDNASGQEIKNDFDSGRREGSRIPRTNRRVLQACAEQSINDRHISMNTTSRLVVFEQRDGITWNHDMVLEVHIPEGKDTRPHSKCESGKLDALRPWARTLTSPR